MDVNYVKNLEVTLLFISKLSILVKKKHLRCPEGRVLPKLARKKKGQETPRKIRQVCWRKKYIKNTRIFFFNKKKISQKKKAKKKKDRQLRENPSDSLVEFSVFNNITHAAKKAECSINSPNMFYILGIVVLMLFF